MLNRDRDYDNRDYEEYEDEEYEVDDDTLILIKRFYIKIGVLLAITIVGFTVYGIVFYDFTPFIVMGFFLLPVIIEGIKIIWDKAKGVWGATITYCGFGDFWPNTQAQALAACLEVFRYYTEPDYISRDRLIELATRFKDNLIYADPEVAVECFDEDCDLSEEEKEFFGIDYDEILNANEDEDDDDLEDWED